MPWGWGGGGWRHGWRGPWPGNGPWSWLPPWMRPGWLFGRGWCWYVLGMPGAGWLLARYYYPWYAWPPTPWPYWGYPWAAWPRPWWW